MPVVSKKYPLTTSQSPASMQRSSSGLRYRRGTHVTHSSMVVEHVAHSAAHAVVIYNCLLNQLFTNGYIYYFF